MEAWATVVIVLVSNAIIGAVSVLIVRKQLEHSAEQFKMELEGQREEEKRERRREVRDEPLVKLRDELAGMASRLERGVHLLTLVSDKAAPETEKIVVRKRLDEAIKEWDAYVKSRVFFGMLHMQYDYEIQLEAHKIYFDYESAYFGLSNVGDSERVDEAINKARAVIHENSRRISEVQSKITRLREEL